MINKYAEVVDGVCVNIIVADSDFVAENMPHLILYTDSNPAYVDGTYENGYFYSPQPFPSWSKNNQGVGTLLFHNLLEQEKKIQIVNIQFGMRKTSNGCGFKKNRASI